MNKNLVKPLCTLVLLGLTSACQDAMLDMGEDEGLRQDHNKEGAPEAGVNPGKPLLVDDAVVSELDADAGLEQSASGSAHDVADEEVASGSNADEDEAAEDDDDAGAAHSGSNSPPSDDSETEPRKPDPESQAPPQDDSAPDEVVVVKGGDVDTENPEPPPVNSQEVPPEIIEGLPTEDGGAAPVSELRIHELNGCSSSTHMSGPNYCDYAELCDGVEIYTYCEGVTDLWQCYSSSPVQPIAGSLGLLVPGDAWNVCPTAALLFEPMQTIPEPDDEGCLSDSTCDDGGACYYAETCGPITDLGAGIKMVSSLRGTAECQSDSYAPEFGSHACQCYGFGANDGEYFVDGASAADARDVLVGVCTSDAPPALGELACQDPSVTLTAGECASARACGAPFEYEGVQINRSTSHYSWCVESDGGAQCNCQGEYGSLTFASNESVGEGAACVGADEICGGQELVVLGPNVCVTTGDFTLEADACYTSFTCSAAAELDGVPVATSTTYSMACLPGDDQYQCEIANLPPSFQVTAADMRGACDAGLEYAAQELADGSF